MEAPARGGEWLTAREIVALWPEWASTVAQVRTRAWRHGWRRQRQAWQGETRYLVADVLDARHRV